MASGEHTESQARWDDYQEWESSAAGLARRRDLVPRERRGEPEVRVVHIPTGWAVLRQCPEGHWHLGQEFRVCEVPAEEAP